MCVLYVSLGSKVKPITFGCNAMGSAVLFILWSRLLLYYVESGVNRMQVVLSRQKLYVWMVVYIGYSCACVCRCDGDVICVGHDLNRCYGWLYVCSVYVE